MGGGEGRESVKRIVANDQRGCLDLAACNNAPCAFGCQPILTGFTCLCPDGYQKVGAGHCVSTITPGAVPPNNPDALNNFPGAGNLKPPFPDFYLEKEGNIPPHEGCYHCDLNKKNGNANNNNNRRFRRDVSTKEQEEKEEEEAKGEEE